MGKPNIKKRPWFNDRCEKAIILRKNFRNLYLNDPTQEENKRKYNESRKEANCILKYEKRAFTKSILEEAEKNHKEHDTHQVYQKINAIKEGYKKYEIFLKNDDGTLFTTKSNILDKWKMYFEQLLNFDDPINTFSWTNTEPNLSVH